MNMYYNINAKNYSIQILSKSEKIKLPLNKENNDRLDSFLDGIEGVVWENPANKTEKRQFETSLKSWFKEFNKELMKFHLENPPTFNGKKAPFKSINLHTMDDQGFEGQIMGDGSFYRWIIDLEVKK